MSRKQEKLQVVWQTRGVQLSRPDMFGHDSISTWLQASDNTRQAQTQSGESWLLPAHETRRVILCSGQIYYTLSRARKSRQIRDVILVRLEQIAPFPHDLVTQVCHTPIVHIMC